MAALTEDRDTSKREGDILNAGVGATEVIFKGGLTCLDATGFAVPGSTATTLVAVGRSEDNVDNSAGADGDLKIDIRKGVYRFGNSASADEITIAEIGDSCYIVDDQTVAKTDGTGTRSVAGEVFDVDSLGVWVKFD